MKASINEIMENLSKKMNDMLKNKLSLSDLMKINEMIDDTSDEIYAFLDWLNCRG